jgi:hypothetical protein
MAEKKESLTEKIQTVVGTVFLIGFLIAGVGAVQRSVWGEQEGTTRTNDCRNSVSVKEGSYVTWFKKFTCSYVKSKSGKIIGGTCVSVETDGAVCNTVYSYDKKSDLHCTDPKFPYVGIDEICHTEPQF